MRLLFSCWRSAFLKNYASVVKELADRGHTVEILVEEPLRRLRGQDELLAELHGHPGVVFVEPEVSRRERWREFAHSLRSTRDHLEFLGEEYADAYRIRSRKRAPRISKVAVALGVARFDSMRRLVMRVLVRLEGALPPSPGLVALLRDRRPDALLITPLVALGSPQPDLLRAAQSLGIPNAVAVHSWDNLSSKSIVRPIPDRLLVWNEVQREEASVRHGIETPRVVVTGAQCYDDLFDAEPRPYEAFCNQVGLDPTRPFILYGCCAPWTFRPETTFVFRWLDAIRAADGPSAEIGVLIRPHPKRPENWATADVSDWRNVVVWPRHATYPAGGDAKADYVDSLAHCSALVAVNTTVMIEAAIRGKQVLTVLDPEFLEVQQGTIHFNYLLDEQRGPLTIARSLEEHVAQLNTLLTEPDRAQRRAEGFVDWFLRPHGASVRATDRFADAIEELAGGPAERIGQRRVDVLLRSVLRSGLGAYDAARWARRSLRRRLATEPG